MPAQPTEEQVQGLRGRLHLRAQPREEHMQGLRGHLHLRAQPTQEQVQGLRGRLHLPPSVALGTVRSTNATGASSGVMRWSRVDSDILRLMVSRALGAGEARCQALEMLGAHEARVAWAAPRGFVSCLSGARSRTRGPADDG